MRVFAPKGRLPEAKFAEGMAPYCVKYYEEKIKINYTLPKLGKSKWCINLARADLYMKTATRWRLLCLKTFQ